MCFPTRVETPEFTPPAAPEPPAEPPELPEIGAARKREEDETFGGTPTLRIDRSITTGGIGSGGAGLKM